MIEATRSGVRIGPVLLGGEEARHEHVAPDAERPPLAGEVLRQVVHRGLGHRVGEHPRERREARGAADVDDARALARRLGPLDEVAAELLA